MQLLSDIRNYRSLSAEKKAYLIAFLTALSGVLSVLDTMIPKPMPLAKLGIANMVSLALVMEGQPGLAFITAVLRTLVSSMMVGTFLSYTFLLSLSGAIGAVAVMALCSPLLSNWLSETGLSVIGAVFNTFFQCCVVALFFGLDRGTVFLISILLLFSVANGIITGLLIRYFYKGMKKGENLK